MRDLLIQLSEAAFWITGGTPLADSVWFSVVWVIFCSVLMVATLMQMINHLSNHPRLIVVLLVPVIPAIFVISTGVPLTQIQMLKECESHSHVIEIENTTREIQINRCRYRSNWYDTEYSDWNLLLN